MGRNARAADGVVDPSGTRDAAGWQATHDDALTLHVLASAHGGGVVHVRTLTSGLARRGVPVVVAMPFDGGHVRREDFTQAGVRSAQWQTDGSVRSIASLAALVRAHRPGLIHTHGARAAVATWFALRLARRARMPWVHSVHGFVTPHHAQPRRFMQQQVERIVARSWCAILTGSRDEQAAIIAARIGRAEDVVVIPQGVDTARFAALTASDRQSARRALALDDTTLVVLSVCRLDRPRDFPTLLHAFANLARAYPDARLLIVGAGPERPSIEALAAQLGLVERMILAGLQHNPAPFYVAADIFVSTSYGWEAFGIATVEAQAAGLPVVVTDAGGAAEAFDPGNTGLLVPVRDAHALGTALRQLATDPARRRAMGQAGRSLVQNRFAIEPMVEAVVGLYRRALALM
jgi:glycosyltransferase involved in cell wall biosynthesis